MSAEEAYNDDETYNDNEFEDDSIITPVKN